MFRLPLLALLWLGAEAAAQPAPPPTTPDAPQDIVEFAAQELTYDEPADVVTATGDVVLRRAGQELTADRVVWDRRVGTVVAEGAVRLADDRGRVLVADRLELSADLKDGAIDNLLLVLADGGRLAARRAVREGGATALDRAIYSPCAVVDEAGCPIRPLWSVRAVRVRHDPQRRRVSYRGARLEFQGIPVLQLPAFSHPESGLRNQSGLLGPDFRVSRQLGAELALPYYWAIAPDRDLTATLHLYSQENPLLAVEYRHLTALGPVQAVVRGTYSETVRIGPSFEVVGTGRSDLRGMLESNGRLGLGADWAANFAVRLTTDASFPGRYQFTYDTRLRTTALVERTQDHLWLGVRGWYFQDLTPALDPARMPVVLPLVDLLWRPAARPLGGRVQVATNALNLFRADGQDMTRLLAEARWERSLFTPLGQRVGLLALLRSDLYHVRDSARADFPLYAGRDGWRGRLVPAAAIDVEWPLAGPLGRGVQTITPRIRLVAATEGDPSGIPNEDSRAVELDDTNLFAFSRFPGYDRFEGGVRLVWGVRWAWTRPGLALGAELGQSFRLAGDPAFVPSGTGLDDNRSDLVGRLTLRAGRLATLTQRFRLDRDGLAVRRSDLDLALGTDRHFATVGYLRYNRDVTFEDLPDSEELRLGAQLALRRFWSVFGSTSVDLTSAAEDPFTGRDGFQPVRSQAGILYRDECLEFRFTWWRNHLDSLNAPRGDSVGFSLKLRNLGQ
ncbi:MAG: LPS assembly protein LptD [Sphingomonadaceae bacterium]|uniref:LPS-assembly protein LptD n=1 Tax=Thermaurantiacus sp. TaxID=2820283 RepID=UPI00298F351D|nr:LPS assembly protein LptD [Thermaurantiacus sp.]MCS6986693.1 LPS assembly protein LptD [Sphingomonadaceae bacterium]MDW8414044.1 LPS assembly protein LptD [Thermaurantiacus sp.]